MTELTAPMGSLSNVIALLSAPSPLSHLNTSSHLLFFPLFIHPTHRKLLFLSISNSRIHKDLK
jgi:hypothetical protein